MFFRLILILFNIGMHKQKIVANLNSLFSHEAHLSSSEAAHKVHSSETAVAHQTQSPFSSEVVIHRTQSQMTLRTNEPDTVTDVNLSNQNHSTAN